MASAIDGSVSHLVRLVQIVAANPLQVGPGHADGAPAHGLLLWLALGAVAALVLVSVLGGRRSHG